VEAYQRETQAQVDDWLSQVGRLEEQVAVMRSEIAKEETETAARLAQLQDETRRLMRDMGFNLMVTHRDTKMSDFWDADFAAVDMPQEYVDRLAADPRLTLVTHLVATLQQKITWENRKVLLVGYLPETPQSHAVEKRPMGYQVKPGTVLLGYELAGGRKPGQTVRVLNRDFQVSRVLREQGSKEDITIAMHLADAQSLLNKPKRINQIMALGCRCSSSDLPNIRKQLAQVLPDAQITEFRSIAVARAEQRSAVETKQREIVGQMRENLAERENILSQRKQILADMEASRGRVQRIIETLAEVLTPLVVLASAIWIGLLALGNVRQRRSEIGVLRALGKGSGTIAALFIGKAVLLGLLGGAAGFLLGTLLAQWLGQRAFDVPADRLVAGADVLLCAVLGAPLVSVVASYLPMLVALGQDPAIALRAE
jgi:putative ABC transport system permease protein